MDYSEYTSRGTRTSEYYVTVSDGVSLKIIDFAPKGDNPRTPVVLFVAGWISLITGWKGVMQKLTPAFRTLYLETREKITSRLPERRRVGFSTLRMAQDIAEIVDNAIPRNRPFVLAGSSLGATAILEHGMLEGKKPLCTILISPIPEFRFPPVLGSILPALHPSLYLAVKPLVKWYLKNFRLDKEREPEQVKKYENTLDAADPYKLKPSAIAVHNYNIWDKLPGITTPSLIIGASSDTLHGTDYLSRMRSLMPHACYRELASNKETHSEVCGELIVEFLKKKDYLEI